VLPKRSRRKDQECPEDHPVFDLTLIAVACAVPERYIGIGKEWDLGKEWQLSKVLSKLGGDATPVLAFFLLWLVVGLGRQAQLKNIDDYGIGWAPFHPVTRPDENEEGRLAKLAKAGDVIAGNTLIAGHVWIAKKLARKYQQTNAEIDDLVQEGTFGLYKAIDDFDPESGRRFSTFAYRAVEWAIRDYLKKLSQLQRHESDGTVGMYARHEPEEKYFD
jgi:hypothetical protein